VGSIFGPVRFLLPVCRLKWFLYTLNIYAHYSSQRGYNYGARIIICLQIVIKLNALILLEQSKNSHFKMKNYTWLNSEQLQHSACEKCSPKGEGGILFYICPSKIFFVAFFSATIDARYLIFCHKLHIGTLYHNYGARIIICLQIVIKLNVLILLEQSKNSHFKMKNYTQISDILSQASYRYPISWEVFLDPSDSYFLFVDFVDFYTHLTYICICTFFSATVDDMIKKKLKWCNY
jgi:hypothetical protein